MSQVFWPYVLKAGHVEDPSKGACAMAAISWLVHGIHSDAPECASPAITKFVIQGNDLMSVEVRQRLIPYLHRIAGSRSPEHEEARSRIIVLAAIRIFAPMVLDMYGFKREARESRNLPDAVTSADVADIEARFLKKSQFSWRSLLGYALRQRSDDFRHARHMMNNIMCALRLIENHNDSYLWENVLGRSVGHVISIIRPMYSIEQYFQVLEDVLNAGPQGEPWSADTMNVALENFWNAAANYSSGDLAEI